MGMLTLEGGQSYAEIVDPGDARPLTPIQHARRIAELAQEKLAADVVILDMRPVCSYTDEVRERLKREEGVVPRSAVGEREGRWILADYLDVVLHVFTPEARQYYRLEELWGDVPSVELAAAG
jgi:ribosome-associated protein